MNSVYCAIQWLNSEDSSIWRYPKPILNVMICRLQVVDFIQMVQLWFFLLAVLNWKFLHPSQYNYTLIYIYHVPLGSNWTHSNQSGNHSIPNMIIGHWSQQVEKPNLFKIFQWFSPMVGVFFQHLPGRSRSRRRNSRSADRRRSREVAKWWPLVSSENWCDYSLISLVVVDCSWLNWASGLLFFVDW